MNFLKIRNFKVGNSVHFKALLLCVTVGGVPFIASCTSVNQRSQGYQLNLPPDPHLTFSGRGAASGPVLMGAMGPSGIAIGLAIDVGIAKDIEKNSFVSGLDIPAIIKSAADTASQFSKSTKVFFDSRPVAAFNLTKIGFVELPAQRDHIMAQIELTVVRGSWQKSYRYPDDWGGAALPAATLDQLKGPASPARELLSQALQVVFERAAVDYSTRK